MKANLIFKYYLALKQFFQSALKGYAKKILILKTSGILGHACKKKKKKKKKKTRKRILNDLFFPTPLTQTVNFVAPLLTTFMTKLL